MVFPLIRPHCTKGAVFSWMGRAYKALDAQFNLVAGKLEMSIDLVRVDLPKMHQEADVDWFADLGEIYAKEYLESLLVKQTCCKLIEMCVDANPPRIIFHFI